MSVLVGRRAPEFSAAAVSATGEVITQFHSQDALKNKYGLIFFYPLDFTFVCPSELIALDKRIDEFKKRNVEVIAVSIDSQFTHLAWRNTPVNKGGIGPVKYTMVADINHNICQSFGVEHPEASVALRGAFIIDKTGIVRTQVVFDLPLGRNIDELIRAVDALQHFESHGEVCPAGWQSGKAGMKATTSGVAEFLSSHTDQL